MNQEEIKARQQERYDRGHKAEDDFMIAYKKKYPESIVNKGTRQQDMFDHIDLFAGPHSYDVKSLKKKSSKDQDVDDQIIWVEFKNVRGNNGWLYGKANRIAFELKDKFICVNRLDLVKVTHSLTIKEFTQYPKAYYLYGRTFSAEQQAQRGYKCSDVMTYIYLEDIKDIILEEILK